MHIKHITVKNFRCFEHLEFDLNPDINIFVGNNGSGKSAVLDAIAAAMYPYVRRIQTIGATKYKENLPIFLEDFPIINKREYQEMEFNILLDNSLKWQAAYHKIDTENNKNNIGTSIKSSSLSDLRVENYHDLSVIGYYKENRNVKNNSKPVNISNKFFDRFDSLKKALDATTNFSDFTNWFFMREFQELREAKNYGEIDLELPELRQIRKAIKKIISPNARVYFTQDNDIKLMVEWTMETGEKRELTLNQLSAGYRNMLALVMDFARRLAQANPHLENPLEAEAILMIDELDLHLHPTWQQKIIPDLRKVFPNTQIIATTHSPEIVTTVDRDQVWILEDYQIKPCPYLTKGMKSSDIVRYVLGLQNLRPDTEESRKLTALFQAIDNESLEEAKRLQQELQEWEFFDADMTRADMQIRRLERRLSV